MSADNRRTPQASHPRLASPAATPGAVLRRRRPVPALLLAASVAPALSACAGSPAAAPTPAAPPATATAAPAQPGHAGAGSIQGPSTDMRWGPVQVTIVVRDKRITDVQATAPTERMRSAIINEQAIPMLRQEVLQAQSANIDAISGATMTSDAFYMSLEAALKQARL